MKASRNFECRLCGKERTQASSSYCQACSLYVAESLGIDGHFLDPFRYGATTISPIVRNLAPVCYLCGEAPSEHADHVIAKSGGGVDEWRNLGAACAHCNYEKGDRATVLSEAQAERLALQQQIFRQALDDLSRNADEFWDSFFEFEVEDAVELLLPEHLEDPEYVDIEVVSYAMGIDTIHHDFPLIPDTAIERAYREVLSRLRAIKPSFE